MPLKLNIGLSQKVADQTYGSRGASVNLELELESSLASEPAKLQERIRQLFALVRTSLTEELSGNGSGHAAGNANGNGQAKPPTNGSENGSSRHGGPRQATHSQIKAIYAIARSRRIDVAQFLNERFRVSRPDDLTLKEASSIIDELKDDSKEGRHS